MKFLALSWRDVRFLLAIQSYRWITFVKSSKQAARLRIFETGNSPVANVYRLDMVYFLRDCLIKPNSISI
jgi:hypothetical protein